MLYFFANKSFHFVKFFFIVFDCQKSVNFFYFFKKMFSFLFSFSLSLCDNGTDEFEWLSLDSLSVKTFSIEANKNYCINGSYFVQGEGLTITAKFWNDLDGDYTSTSKSENAKGVLGKNLLLNPISSLFSTKSQTIYAFTIEPSYEERVTIKDLPFTVTRNSIITTKKSSSLSSELKVSINSKNGGSIKVSHIKVINTESAAASITASHDVPMNVQAKSGNISYSSDKDISGEEFIIVEPDYQRYVEREITPGTFSKSLSTSYSMDTKTSGSLNEFQYKLNSNNIVLNDSNLEEYEEASYTWVLIVIIVVIVVILVGITIGFLIYCWRRRRSYEATSITSQLL